ncbi:MAG: class III cytochrome c [Desulfobulbus propionicus]|nr:MAG: class III cytochrome c [Desulfobulbus propionicus]PIE60646.1 MAG: class III cytochrome c [Desulfobulbus propionicus]
MRKLLVCSIALSFVCLVGMGVSTAADKGPENMTLKSTIDPAKKAKPAIFPHGEHQGRLECGECHHAKDADGKQVAYVEGQEIKKCESCHNSKESMPKKLATFKGAAHEQCKGCHKTTSKELAKCSTCHPKKK